MVANLSWRAGGGGGGGGAGGHTEAKLDIADEGGTKKTEREISHPPAAADPDHENVLTLSNALNLPRWRDGTLSIIRLFMSGRPQLANAVRDRWRATKTSLW